MVGDLVYKKRLSTNLSRPHLPRTTAEVSKIFCIRRCPLPLWRIDPGFGIITLHNLTRHIFPYMIDNATKCLLFVQKPTFHEKTILFEKCNFRFTEGWISVCKFWIDQYIGITENDVFADSQPV